MNLKINTLITQLTHQLESTYSHSSEQHAWWLLMAVTMRSKEQLLANPIIQLSPEQEAKLTRYLDQLITHHMPFAYVVGFVPFGDLEILTQPPILIPRPETEEWVLALAHQLHKITQPVTILDMCTGSGCIALALAHALPNAQVYGVDINPHALELAKKNAQHNGITNVTWIQSNLFTDLPRTLSFDLIISNPPYISKSEWQTLDKSVKEWEDPQALTDSHDGLAILASIIHQAPLCITPNSQLQLHNIPQLTVEIGYNQGHSVLELFEKAGFKHIKVSKDLAHHDRTVSGRVDHVAISKKER